MSVVPSRQLQATGVLLRPRNLPSIPEVMNKESWGGRRVKNHWARRGCHLGVGLQSSPGAVGWEWDSGLSCWTVAVELLALL